MTEAEGTYDLLRARLMRPEIDAILGPLGVVTLADLADDERVTGDDAERLLEAIDAWIAESAQIDADLDRLVEGAAVETDRRPAAIDTRTAETTPERVEPEPVEYVTTAILAWLLSCSERHARRVAADLTGAHFDEHARRWRIPRSALDSALETRLAEVRANDAQAPCPLCGCTGCPSRRT